MKASAIAILGVLLAVPAGEAAAASAEEGKILVGQMCVGCHNENAVSNSSGYTADEWRSLIGTMVDLSGTDELESIVLWLAAEKPPTSRRAPKLASGPLAISFEEWRAPTPGQRARDPAEAPDRAIWWAGQWADLVGRIDPATGEVQEFPIPAGSRPHTVTVAADGGIWFTGNGNGTIGRLDPATGESTVYRMPDPAARDPHSAVFDAEGILWFSLQGSNMIGRLDPATGKIDLVGTGVAGARPYGIKIGPDGAPFVASNGSPHIFRVDPRTMAIRAYEMPDPATKIRRLAFAGDGAVWFVNSTLGRIGRLDPATGAVKEWDSPSGPRSHPYAIAVIDDIVWYNESGQRPDALVRFDPASESFQSWPIPSAGVHAGIVRHMRPTRDGDLLIHQSSTATILRVAIPKPD